MKKSRLNQKESLYQTIFDAMEDGIIIQDVSTGLVVQSNPSAAKMHGYTREQAANEIDKRVTDTDLFLFPFAGLTVTPAVGGMVLELSSFFAMVIYGLLAWAIERTIWVIFYRPRGPVVEVTRTRSEHHHTH